MNLVILGEHCRRFRIDNNITVKQISQIAHYSTWNVYKFEQGKVDNASILLVYMSLGLVLDRRTICQVLTNC